MSMSVQQVDAVKFSYEPWTWPFSETRRAEIERVFLLGARGEHPAFGTAACCCFATFGSRTG